MLRFGPGGGDDGAGRGRLLATVNPGEREARAKATALSVEVGLRQTVRACATLMLQICPIAKTCMHYLYGTHLSNRTLSEREGVL
jgi:hypothetical protein